MMADAKEKVEELQELDVTKDVEHVGAVLAYTDETPLYGDLNLTMRKKVPHSLMTMVTMTVMAMHSKVMHDLRVSRAAGYYHDIYDYCYIYCYL